MSREEGGCTDPSSPPTTPTEPTNEAVDGSGAKEEHSEVLPVVEVVRKVGDPFLFGAPLLGISSFTLSLAINLFTNQLNFLGLDWVEEIKNLTLSSQPLEFSSPNSATIRGEPPQASTLEPNEVKVLSPCSSP